ncbi:hypothetical protein [Mitsuaria sp. GD03876]|uniref:hypothetical protein n=1 Tax=Mitsuaria sp. GD03876 TaxID=2975399 RepID=UPI00244BA051|nr:hypothetical protein [Mitsuaria sp. GD03876]MDH0863306.1 hypothetical protein [Mitsuaria sp. GD03876]
MEIDVFTALSSAGVSEAKARSAAESIRQEVTEELKRGVAHLATKSDIADLRVEMANLRADFFQRFSDMQRSQVAVMCSGFSVIVAMMTLFKFLD